MISSENLFERLCSDQESLSGYSIETEFMQSYQEFVQVWLYLVSKEMELDIDTYYLSKETRDLQTLNWYTYEHQHNCIIWDRGYDCIIIPNEPFNHLVIKDLTSVYHNLNPLIQYVLRLYNQYGTLKCVHLYEYHKFVLGYLFVTEHDNTVVDIDTLRCRAEFLFEDHIIKRHDFQLELDKTYHQLTMSPTWIQPESTKFKLQQQKNIPLACDPEDKILETWDSLCRNVENPYQKLFRLYQIFGITEWFSFDKSIFQLCYILGNYSNLVNKRTYH